MGKREQAREETRSRILQSARRQVVEHGGAGLSMRAVARDLGMVSSAVFRYFATRDALLTAMVVESYERLAATLAEVRADGHAATWTALAMAFRAWARQHPQEFQLIYGTPIPGYAAPPETIAPAADVAAPFLTVGARQRVPGFHSAGVDALPGDPSGVAAVLGELAALVGFIGLELAGHFIGTADPADALFAAVVDRQVATLGL